MGTADGKNKTEILLILLQTNKKNNPKPANEKCLIGPVICTHRHM